MTAWTPSERRRLAFVLTTVLTVWSGCGDDDGASGPQPGAGGEGGAEEPEPSSGAPGLPSAGGASGADSGAAGGPAGAGGAPSVGGADGESAGAGGEGVVLPDPDSICPASMMLGDRDPIAEARDYGALAAVTADELVAAWVAPAGDKLRVRVASRSAASSAFGAPIVQDLDTPDPVALSPDGLELTLVNPDRRGFSLMSRASLSMPFEPAPSGVFSLIDEAMENAPEGELLGEPVITPDGAGLYYLRYGDGRTETLLQSRRISPFAPWPSGAPVAVDEDIVADDVILLRPVAASFDSKTLFLFDAQADETVAFRLLLDGSRYTRDTSFAGLGRVATNADCTRVYSSSSDGTVSYVSGVATEE